MFSNEAQNRLAIGQCATLACFLEATAPKPGNVHRGADFDDLTYPDLILSAIVIGPVMENAPHRRLGETILDAVRATREAVGTNTNLGTILLIAPLATVPREHPLAQGVADVLGRLDAEDSRLVYEAIAPGLARRYRSGGCGRYRGRSASRPDRRHATRRRSRSRRPPVCQRFSGIAARCGSSPQRRS